MIKNLYIKIFTLVVMAFLVFPHTMSAQSYCSFVDISNAFNCCDSSNYPINKTACDDYRNAPVPISGTPPTNPVNNGGSSGGSSSVSGAGSSSGLDTSSCSAIRFKSVIDILIWLKCIIVAVLIPLIFSTAFLVFLWGIFKFMSASDVKTKQEGQKIIWWGIIGLFVMVSVWGIVKILGDTLGIESTVPLLQTEYLK